MIRWHVVFGNDGAKILIKNEFLTVNSDQTISKSTICIIQLNNVVIQTVMVMKLVRIMWYIKEMYFPKGF